MICMTFHIKLRYHCSVKGSRLVPTVLIKHDQHEDSGATSMFDLPAFCSTSYSRSVE